MKRTARLLALAPLTALTLFAAGCRDEVPGVCGVYGEDLETRGDAERVCEIFTHSLENENCVDVYGYNPLGETPRNFCEDQVRRDGDGRFYFDLRTECAIITCAPSRDSVRPRFEANEAGEFALWNEYLYSSAAEQGIEDLLDRVTLVHRGNVVPRPLDARE